MKGRDQYWHAAHRPSARPARRKDVRLATGLANEHNRWSRALSQSGPAPGMGASLALALTMTKGDSIMADFKCTATDVSGQRFRKNL
jgi:hypothetical protein